MKTRITSNCLNFISNFIFIPISAKLVSPAANEYQVIAHHFRYSSEVENVISDKTFKVTVLRDPIHNFESGFGFFRDYPYKQWLGEKPDIKKFLGNPHFYYNTSTPWHFRAKNYMGEKRGNDNMKDFLKTNYDI